MEVSQVEFSPKFLEFSVFSSGIFFGQILAQEFFFFFDDFGFLNSFGRIFGSKIYFGYILGSRIFSR